MRPPARTTTTAALTAFALLTTSARAAPADVLIDEDPAATCRAEHRALRAASAAPLPTCWRHLRLGAAQIELSSPIGFEIERWQLRHSSLPILDEVAALLALHAELRIEIQGHYHDDPSRAVSLSARRAKTVAVYLIHRGVAPDRLETIAYGDNRPLVSPRDRAAARRNWRIELHVLPPRAP